MLVLGRTQPVSQHSSRGSGRHLPVGIRQEMLERGSLDEDVCLQHPNPEKQASLFSCQVWPENPSTAQLFVPALRRPAGSQALCLRTGWVPGGGGGGGALERNINAFQASPPPFLLTAPTSLFSVPISHTDGGSRPSAPQTSPPPGKGLEAVAG